MIILAMYRWFDYLVLFINKFLSWVNDALENKAVFFFFFFQNLISSTDSVPFNCNMSVWACIDTMNIVTTVDSDGLVL